LDFLGCFIGGFPGSKDWILQFFPLTLGIFGFIWIYLDLFGRFLDRSLSSKDWILRFSRLILEIIGFIWIYLVGSSIDPSPQKIGYYGFSLCHWEYLDLFGFFRLGRR